MPGKGVLMNWYVDEDYMPFEEREKAEIRALKEFLIENKGKWVCVFEGDSWDDYEYWRDVCMEIDTLGLFSHPWRREHETSSDSTQPRHRLMMKYK